MDRTEVNASPVQKALQGIKKYKYVLLTALLGVLLLLLPQNEKAADSGSRDAVRRGKFRPRGAAKRDGGYSFLARRRPGGSRLC